METDPANPLQYPKIPLAPTPASPSIAQAFQHTQNAISPYPPSFPSPGSPSNDISPSAQARHQLTRPLSPDLPTRDALYLFCNFSSYMRSPQEGPEGIKDNTDFHDTIRLLDFARTLAGNPHAHVHVLHMKYRFQTPDQGLPTTRQAKLSALNYKDNRGRGNATVPQPFSTLHDPVIKVDYQDNGVFFPLPAQALFQHISKSCQPPPRIIVVSYVCSMATENHVASVATWAHTSTPPIYVFSPLETRLRERRPLADALHHAIPISMYASPLGALSPSPRSADRHPSTPLPQRLKSKSQDDSAHALAKSPTSPKYHSPLTRRASADSRELRSPDISRRSEYSPRTYPSDPVATLSILTDAHRSRSRTDPDAPGDRVPLWMLAPGAGILHGSTSASLGVKLSDFSAVNLLRSLEKGDKGSKPQNQTIDSRALNMRVSPAAKKDGPRVPKVSLPPLEPHARRGLAATPEPISRTSSAASIRISSTNGNGKDTTHAAAGQPTMHLTPPDQDPRRLSPPDQRPPLGPSPSQQSWPRTKSWPTTRDRVPGWKRGRREVMEDALQEGQMEAEMGGSDALSIQVGRLILDGVGKDEGLLDVEDVISGALKGL